jgi:anhydro-N-acetylmuramic acid kinase
MSALNRLQVLGLMSGTSLDGLDLCLCDVRFSRDRQRVIAADILAFSTLPLPEHLKQQVLTQMNPATSAVDQLCDLNFAWSHYAATAIAQFLTLHHCSFDAVDLIGSHGQTLYHRPPATESGFHGSTLQLGDGGVLAALTGITTVTQFRTADMALGGQGAPLVPFLDRCLFHSSTHARILLNIGGMANLTYLDPGGKMQAFDTGPGNVLLDAAAQYLTGQAHDWDGALALQGMVHAELLEQVLEHPFFSQAPPRSTGREVFGVDYAQHLIEKWQNHGLSTPDILATLTAVTTTAIVRACGAFLPPSIDELYLSGGGVHNRALWQGLQQGLPDVKIDSLTALGGNPDAKEAQAFAVLAAACVQGLPADLTAVTGAMQSVVLGQIAPGQNWLALCNKIQSQSKTQK